MASRRVDQEAHARILSAYREDPGNHSYAARAAGVTRRTAKKAWADGFPGRTWGDPIERVIERDRELARSRLQHEKEAAELAADKAELEADRDAEAARQHAIQAYEEEGRLVQAARRAALSGLGATVQALPGVAAAMKRMSKELTEMSESGQAWGTKDLGHVSSLSRRLAATMRDVVIGSQAAMEMQRLYLGEPTKVIGVTSDLDALPMAELEREVSRLAAAVQRSLPTPVIEAASEERPEDATPSGPRVATGKA